MTGGGEARLAALERRLDDVESRLAVADLVAAYAQGADHRDEELWRSVWTEHAVWDVGGGRRFQGPDAIVDAIRTQWRGVGRMLHATTNHRVALEGDAGTGVSDVVVLGLLPEREGEQEATLLGAGVYRDRYAHIDGRWLIEERRATDDFWVLAPPGR